MTDNDLVAWPEGLHYNNSRHSRSGVADSKAKVAVESKWKGLVLLVGRRLVIN
jgi:hypothetical protein